MPGRREKNVTNPQAHEAWKRRKKELNAHDAVAGLRQIEWRKDCLRERALENRLTEKNKAELERLEA